MRYGNEESRTVIKKILNHHHDQEKPLFVLLVWESGLGKTSYLLQLLGEFLWPYRHQDMLWIRDCTKELEKTHTLAVETPSSQKIIPLSNWENYENKWVREISTWLQQSAFSGKKCLLIENLERMSNAAMNAFLKTCEEPLKHRFIFATVSDESAILPTIFSRALVVRFSPLSTSQMLDFLQNKTLINNQKLIDMVVKMARGRSWLWLTLLKELEKDGDLAEFFVDGFSQFLQQDSQYLKLQFLKKIQEFWMLDLFIDALISYYVDAWDQSSIEAWIEVKKMRNQSINEENLLRYGVLS